MRNTTFDIMKGIAIMLMVIGHSLPWGGVATRAIYAFHMPLFFIVSGYFFKTGKKFKYYLFANVRQLLVPYFVTAIFGFLLSGLRLSIKTSGNIPMAWNEIKTGVLAMAWGWGNVSIFPDARLVNMPDIGAIWFFLAMFWCRIIYKILRESIQKDGLLTLVVILCGGCAYWISHYVNVPWSICQGLTAMIFFHFGHLTMKHSILEREHRIIIIIAASCYIAALLWGGNLSMVNFLYDSIPLNIIGAFGGTYLVFHISRLFSKIKLSLLLSFLGRESLIILCIHHIDIVSHLSLIISHYLYIPIIINRLIVVTFAACCLFFIRNPKLKLILK